MKMRLILFLNFFFFICAYNIGAQSLQSLLSTGNQYIVETAVKECFGIVRQEYQLKDPNSCTKYNLDSLDYFGFTESICIKTQEGIIVSNSLNEPWLQDSNFKDYQEYEPVLSALSVYDDNEKTWIKTGVITPNKIENILFSDKSIIWDSLLNFQGFQIDSTYGAKDGWIIWIKKNEYEISINSLRQKISERDSLGNYCLNKNIEGDDYQVGIFVTTDFLVPGSVSFKIFAVVEKFQDGWKAIPIKQSSSSSKERKLVEVVKETPATAISQDHPDTPVNRRKRIKSKQI